MDLSCIWEHNGQDTLLYCVDYPGAFTRGASLEEALAKMPREVQSFCSWAGMDFPRTLSPIVTYEKFSDLNLRDADSDVIFPQERLPLTQPEYQALTYLALKSARDFQALYDSLPDKNRSVLPPRKTFYGSVPITGEDMYQHTKHVNDYYFSEIGVEPGNEGTILQCRERGLRLLEQQEGFLRSPAVIGSYNEEWSLRKVLRRFLWHDRIHAKAMYRMALKTFDPSIIADVFHLTCSIK